jgi:hypothetical protein
MIVLACIIVDLIKDLRNGGKLCMRSLEIIWENVTPVCCTQV